MSERSAPGGGNLDLFRDREAPAPRVWTVSQVNRAVRLMLEQTLPQMWVTGEVANFSRHRSGHCYFTLKDSAAQLRCVMFRREARALPTDPEDGMTLRVFGGLTLYEARGGYQFVVTRLEAEQAEGMWKLAFDRLRRKLDAEGLTDPARRRPLPEFPRSVGVVTSPGSAALRDIVAVTARRAPWLRLLVRGTGVQGRGSGAGIAAAITTLARRGVDLIVVARGGGSIEDLWGFNEEPVARAVAECPVPVVSGVGHETDVTICDLVADLRAATPSAAAEAVAPDRKALARRLDGLRQRLGKTLAAQARGRRWRLDAGGSRLSEAVRRLVRHKAGRLAAAAAAMEALSPLSTLARGYAVPLDPEGRLLRTTRDFAPARGFRLRVVDGSVPCVATGAPERQPGMAESGR
ncbi:MAG: exodeoxyribonuclease VII large subunit [Gemmatimonadota bacterium]|nr:exodeoxyribonuclease VII large subunit [Gemmatimonadota bacterium]